MISFLYKHNNQYQEFSYKFYNSRFINITLLIYTASFIVNNQNVFF